MFKSKSRGTDFLNARVILVLLVAVKIGFLAGFGFSQNVATRSDVQAKLSTATLNGDCSLVGMLGNTTHVLINTMRKMARAHRYARSTKTLSELSNAYGLLMGLFNTLDNATLTEKLTNTRLNIETRPGIDVCPEKWDGTTGGYPYYVAESNFRETNCTPNKPDLQSLFTIVVSTKGTGLTHSDVQYLVDRTYETYDHVRLILATSFKNVTSKFMNAKTSKPATTSENYITIVSLTELDVEAGTTVTGADLNQLIEKVGTKYTFVASQLTDIDYNARIHRLIRLLDFTNATIVGASHRNNSGHWKIDCYATAMRNYQYRLVEGYDLSYNSCVYCDYIGGPFMARTTFLKTLPFNKKLKDEFSYIDFFEQLKRQPYDHISMVCPDAMITTLRISRVHSYSRDDWMPFMKSWDLQRILPPKLDWNFLDLNCSGLEGSCRKAKGMGTHLCCLKELTDMDWAFQDACEKNNIGCEIEAGTAVGAEKFQGTIPWELDSDFDYSALNHTAVRNLTAHLKSKGYTLNGEEMPKCKPYKDHYNVNCGYFALRSAHWRSELWGGNALSRTHYAETSVRNPTTRVLIDGRWFPSFPNPVASSRNLYGDDLFAHVEHWIHQGYSTGWIPYKTGVWLPCNVPGHHACLDQFFPTGNLQFFDVWI